MLKIIWSPQASENYLEQLSNWITHNKSSDYSLKIIAEVEKFEEIILLNPLIGREIEQIPDVRMVLILRRFYLYYRVNKKGAIEIVEFKSTKQDDWIKP